MSELLCSLIITDNSKTIHKYKNHHILSRFSLDKLPGTEWNKCVDES